MSAEAYQQTPDNEPDDVGAPVAEVTGETFGDTMVQKADTIGVSFYGAAVQISTVALNALRYAPVVISYRESDVIDGKPVRIARRPL